MSLHYNVETNSYTIMIAKSTGPEQSCPASLYCCQNLNSCSYAGCDGAGNPSTFVPPPPNDCASLPDNHIVCTSSSTFNYCLANGLICF